MSLGKNKESPLATDDYVRGIRVMGEFADYIVINVSSPNTPGLRDIQARDQLACLLDAVSQCELCVDVPRMSELEKFHCMSS